jgi:hypothetical protein
MATVAALSILAHQGGWDEILFVLAPLLVFGGLLALARRRVEQLDPDGTGDTDTTEPAREPEGSDPA